MATQLTDATAQVPALTREGEMFALRQRQARMFASSPLVPEHLRKGTPEQAIANCWIALTLAEAMGEVPLIVMQNIHVVSGKAGFASQYMIARANSSGIFKGRIDWRIDRTDPNNLAVTAYAKIKDSGQEVEVTCDMKMAKAEGWTKNNKYSTMPEVMLRYRSAAFLVRFYAPDVMLGYQTVEEVEDVIAAAVPVNEPLTAQMLIEQSQPTLKATPGRDDRRRDLVVDSNGDSFDGRTGELIPDDQLSPEERGAPDEEPPEVKPEPATLEAVAGQADDDESPAEKAAASWIDSFDKAETIIDLKGHYAESELDRASFNDELSAKVEQSYTDNTARLTKQHADSKAREQREAAEEA